MLEDEGVEPEMPPLEWGLHLVQYLFKLGPTVIAGMGAGPIPPPYIETWERRTGIELSPWEFEQILRMSSEYAGESALASKPDRPAPYAESSDAQRLRAAQLQRKMDAFLD
jgi:hypothetical protein